MWTQTKKIASYTRFLRERALIYKRTRTEQKRNEVTPPRFPQMITTKRHTLQNGHNQNTPSAT